MRTLGISLCLSCLLWLSACTPSALDVPSPAFEADLSLTTPFEKYDGRDALQRTTIDRVVWEQIFAYGPFRWENADDYLLWSAVINSDSIVSLGYQPQGYANLDETIHLVDVNSKPWKTTREALLDFIVTEENRDRVGAPLTLEDIQAFGEKELPYLNVKISSFNTLAQLRRMKVVRYLDPMGYGIEPDVDHTRSNSGCGGGAASNLTSADYNTVSPNAKASWHYDEHGIRTAWNTSTGDNITVGVIDTGISPNQNKLNSNFSSGQSTGRFRDKLGTFVTGWWWWASIDGPDDDCGHARHVGAMA
ncbi:MAG: protease, partial [Bacteroidota bacterium]